MFWISCILLILTPLACITVVIIVCIRVDVPLDIKYDECPWLIFLYLRAFCIGLRREQGKQVLKNGEVSKNINDNSGERLQIIARDCRIEWRYVQKYAALCGYTGTLTAIPPCYLESLFLPLLLILITSQHFRLSPLGLIHLRQTLSQHTSLEHLFKEPFDLECSVLVYRPSAKGVEVDFSLKVYDRREMCVWEGISTLLSRSKHIRHIDLQPRKDSQDFNTSDTLRKSDHLLVKLPASLGVRVAWATGDWNLHHLWVWSARLLGYRHPIAHGMWTMARSLCHLDTSGTFPLMPPFSVTASFKRPIFLPGTALFTFSAQPNKDMYCFSVEDAATAVTQLTGKVQRC